MLISTKSKIALARLAYSGIAGARKILGFGHEAEVQRYGLRWTLDLREGIDLAIYMFGKFEPGTIKAYRKLIKPGDVVADIGANMGAHTLWLSRYVGPAGKVLAFEPTAGAYRRLQRNVSGNPELAARIVARQAMLVADAGQPPEPSLYASWRVDGHEPGDSHALHGGIPVSTDGATSLTLDRAVESHGRIALIKLDVDGHELDVLSGARTVLGRDRPVIVMELAPYTMTERGQSIEELASLLEANKYGFRHLDGRPIPKAELSRIPGGSSINIIASAG